MFEQRWTPEHALHVEEPQKEQAGLPFMFLKMFDGARRFS